MRRAGARQTLRQSSWTVRLPLRVPVGGLAEVRVKVPKWIVDRGLELELSEAPPGISLSAARPDHRRRWLSM